MGQRLEVAKEYISQGYKVKTIAKICEVSRSAIYYNKQEKEEKSESRKQGRPPPGYTVNPDGTVVTDRTLIKILENYRNQAEFSNAGGCKILHEYIELDYGFTVNHKKIYRLCKEHKLLLPRNTKKIRKDIKVCMNRKINGPNQLWQFDIKYGYIHGENRFFYLLAFIDVFTKEIVGYYIGLTCKGLNLKQTFEAALKSKNLGYDSKLVIRSDRGSQMTSNMFRGYIEDTGMEHEYTPPRDPNKNAYIESFFSIYETEFLQVWYFDKYMDAYRETVTFINRYNNRRLHGSIKKLPPVEFARRYESGEFGVINLRA